MLSHEKHSTAIARVMLTSELAQYFDHRLPWPCALHKSDSLTVFTPRRTQNDTMMAREVFYYTKYLLLSRA